MAIQRARWKRGTAAEWTSANPVLRLGEPGWETDTQQGKVGDGTTAWNSLSYHIGAGGGGGGGGDVPGDTHAAASKTTPVDADEIPLVDSAALFVLKKLTWANLKAGVKTYLDGTGVAKLTTARTINGVSFDGTGNIAPRLDQIAAPTSDVSLATHKLTSVTDPTSAQHAATKNYVDNTVSELLAADSLLPAIEATLPGTTITVPYDSGATTWHDATYAGLATETNVGFLFTGGSDADPPFDVAGPATWVRTP